MYSCGTYHLYTEHESGRRVETIRRGKKRIGQVIVDEKQTCTQRYNLLLHFKEFDQTFQSFDSQWYFI